jgi:hypothetical protein
MWRRQRPAFDSSAPTEWTTGGSASARLYCRLLAAVQAADESVALAREDQFATGELDDAVHDLRRQATAITEHLVVVSRLPVGKRQRALRPLRSPVDEVERLAARIGRSAADARGYANISDGLEEVAVRLRTLEEARAEVEVKLPDVDRRSLTHRLDRITTRPSAWLRQRKGGDS